MQLIPTAVFQTVAVCVTALIIVLVLIFAEERRQQREMEDRDREALRRSAETQSFICGVQERARERSLLR